MEEGRDVGGVAVAVAASVVVAVAVAVAMVQNVAVAVAVAHNYLRLCIHHLALELASLPEVLERGLVLLVNGWHEHWQASVSVLVIG